MVANALKADIVFVLDGHGAALTAGVYCPQMVPFDGKILGVTLLADQNGSCIADVLSTTTALYAPGTHPVAADSITATDKPTLATAAIYQDGTLTGWNTALVGGSVVAINLTAPATITKLTVSLHCEKNPQDLEPNPVAAANPNGAMFA